MSSSSSEYSDNAGDADDRVVTKRVGSPSKGGADRRRLAIVELNDLTRLALVAPPDAAVHSYTHLTPPPTHRAAASDTTPTSIAADREPVAQRADHRDHASPIRTPQIGERKDIHIPVAPPVVVNVEQSIFRSFPPPTSAPTHHVFGRHVGELRDVHHRRSPAPGVAHNSLPMTDIQAESAGAGYHDRPPIHRREAATAQQGPSLIESPSRQPLEIPTEENQLDDILEPSLSQQPNLPSTRAVDPPSSRRDLSPLKVDHSKFDRWLNEHPQFATTTTRSVTTHDLPRGGSFDEPHRPSLHAIRPQSPMSADHHHHCTILVEPPEAPKGFKYNLATNLKRISSLSRRSSKNSRSSQDTRHSRTPSPLSHHHHQKRRPHFQRIISINPPALFCHEVDGQNTTLQRSMIYANKINELYLHDCGLSVWITQMREHSLNPHRPRGPSSSHLLATQPRQTSRSSVMSEVTFPRRPDATTATDLTQGQSREATSPGLIPQLPYPSLAINSLRSAPARSNTSSSSNTPSSSLRSLAPAVPSFLASLGRKASLSKRERTTMTPPISSPMSAPNGARLPIGRKNGQPPNPSPPAPRPIQITTTPSIPGGPRAPPSRAKRSQTYITPPSTAARHNLLGRRPSLADGTLDGVIDITPDPAFSQQVDKLAALLPRANKEILAGYLRRAGTDMLAIGQYLEDELTGTIRLQ